jgi:hypothetical protein
VPPTPRICAAVGDDGAIHDAIPVIADFNDIDRIAGAVGIGSEPEWEAR